MELVIVLHVFNAFWKGNSPKYLQNRYYMTQAMAKSWDLKKNVLTTICDRARTEPGAIQPQDPGPSVSVTKTTEN